jgi:phage tail sheath gpL-like
MADAVNNVLGCPFIATVDVSDQLVLTSGWKGVSSAEIDVEILTTLNGQSAVGLTYAEESKVSGTGEPSLTVQNDGSTLQGLSLFGDEWNTMVVNCVGSSDTLINALQSHNGNPNTKTGRYSPTTVKPYVAFTGKNSVDTLAEVLAITDTPSGRKDECTFVHAPAPNSKGFSFEAAANMCAVYAPLAQNTPHRDPVGLTYPDMPIETDTSFGDYADTTKRDQIVKAGGSTVKLGNGKYEIVDMVTTYHPEDEVQQNMLFRWVRDIIGLDFNYKYSYYLLVNKYLKGKTIVNPGESSAPDTIDVGRWKSILISEYGPSLISNALMADIDNFTSTLQVQIGEENPNRFETNFESKRTGVVRVAPTTNQTSFNVTI